MHKIIAIILMCAATVPAWGARPSRQKVDPATLLESARTLAQEYRPAEAREKYDEYEQALKRNRKTVSPEIEAEREALITMENMLERVERIAVIDSLTVDSVDFFTHYRLSAEAGRFVTGSMARLPKAPMAFIPQSNTELIYAQPDSTGRYTVMGADILDDGTLDHARDLGLERGGGDARFPFLMPDGVTLYYASNGDESLGGYDIFMTRRSDDGFLQPQNVGMPYNSPDNDYLLAIDETTGAGWWATDRNHIPGKVTIYVFVPSATRVNVSPDAPDLASLARLSDISLTHAPGADYTALRDRIAATAEANPGADHTTGSSFEIWVGNKAYRRLSDFTTSAGRAAMARAINARAAIASTTDRLAALREKYRRGDHSTETDILNLELQLEDSRAQYADAVNQAIAAETGEQ